jgi:hypothetical protein
MRPVTGTAPLGNLLAGFVAGRIGVAPTLIVNGLICIGSRQYSSEIYRASAPSPHRSWPRSKFKSVTGGEDNRGACTLN